MQTTNDSYSKLQEDDLVTMAQRGDDNAFTELMQRRQPACINLAYSILRNREDAEDEVQNALWKAYSNMGSLNDDNRFSAWLSRIVVNQCYMRLRKQRRQKFLQIDHVLIGEDMGTMELPDTRRTPEELLAVEESAEVLHREAGRIPPLLRNVFILRDIEKRPMPEVARELGVTVAAAKSRLQRARRTLRSSLVKHMPAREFGAEPARP